MNRSLTLLLIFALIFCAGVLALSIYPGMLQGFTVILLCLLLLLGFGLAIAIYFVRIVWQQRGRSRQRMLLRLGAIAFIFVGTYGLLKFYVPRRLAFALSRPAFEQWLFSDPPLLAAPPFAPGEPQPPIQLGAYVFDQAIADPRGGVYLRVNYHGDGLGPDILSYGFAYQPNLEGSPFGNASYQIYALGDGWYWFQASDDW
ncbi:MAG TPA: hypothetical protein V6C88_07970 [Chroococcidiopsis sp.]